MKNFLKQYQIIMWFLSVTFFKIGRKHFLKLNVYGAAEQAEITRVSSFSQFCPVAVVFYHSTFSQMVLVQFLCGIQALFLEVFMDGRIFQTILTRSNH